MQSKPQLGAPMDGADAPGGIPPGLTGPAPVKIPYTQHKSAQGIIQCVDQEKALTFRSFMELTHLLEEALQPRDDTEELRTWQDAKGLRTEWR